MSNQQEQLEAIRDIRSMMERSSRFLSLSGLAGVVVGIIALIGVISAYVFLGISPMDPGYYRLAKGPDGLPNTRFIQFFFVVPTIVLLVSLMAGVWMATRKARKSDLPLWDATAKRMAVNMAIPLLSGGLYCLILYYHDQLALIAPTTLIFYGLALVNASKYTINDIRYLGIMNILTGLAALVMADYALLFWAFGFGILHIVYGIAIHYKYEK
jgi:hypothetical protein